MAERKRTELDWEDLRIFLALARHGSLSAAARAMGVNHATIARRIRALESDVGDKLVERRPDGYVLTPAGMQAMTVASDMEAAAQSIGRSGPDSTPGGLVRINAPPALSHGFLTSRLAGIVTLYPALDIDLATDIRAVSLERYEADIAVRFSRPVDGDLIARPLMTVGYGFYGTAAACGHIEKGGAPVFIGFDEADTHVPEAGWLARQFPRARLAFRAGNQFTQAMAARSGAGIALLPHYIGRMEATLQPCDLGATPPDRDAWLITRQRDRKSITIRAVADHIARIFEEERSLFEP